MWKDIIDWFQSPPKIAKILLVPSVLVPISCRLGIVSPYALLFDWNAITKHFEIWRLLTPLFFAPLSINLLFILFYRYQSIADLELKDYQSCPADLVYFLLLASAAFNIAAVFLPMYVFSDGFTMTIIYLWSQLHKETFVHFLFGIRFKAIFLPWALMGIEFLSQKPLFESLLGILIGHAYYFFHFVYPTQYGSGSGRGRGQGVFRAPLFLQGLFPAPSLQVGASGAYPPQSQATTTKAREASSYTSVFQGKGYRLGSGMG